MNNYVKGNCYLCNKPCDKDSYACYNCAIERERHLRQKRKIPSCCPVCNSLKIRRLKAHVEKAGYVILARCLKCGYEMGVKNAG